MASWNEPARPDPKPAPRPKRQRRHVATPKQWAVIVEAKAGPCRVCTVPAYNGASGSRIEFHHVVPRDYGGDDYAANIVPVHDGCHRLLHERSQVAGFNLAFSLTDSEYRYAVGKVRNVFERVYGIRYER